MADSSTLPMSRTPRAMGNSSSLDPQNGGEVMPSRVRDNLVYVETIRMSP